jgi:acyl transferase domain-containing protein
VAERGRLVSELPPGSMIAVPLPEEELAERLSRIGDPELALAAVNAPGLCAVAGPDGAIDALVAALEADGVAVRRLHTSHAFHSPMLDPAVESFRRRVAACALRPPRIPFFSNVTGTWITDEQATDPGYWARQLRAPVRFSDAAAELLAEPRRVLLEVGPGDALAKLVRRHPEARSRVVAASLPHATDPRPDGETVLEAAGRLWVAGVATGERYGDLDLERDLDGGPPRRRVRLPTYPFGGGRHWIEATPRGRAAVSAPGAPRAGGTIAKEPDPGDWFYAPVWRSVPRPAPRAEPGRDAPARWLLLGADAGAGAGVAEALAAELGRRGEEVVTVASTAASTAAGGEDLDALLGRLVEADRAPTRVLHLMALTSSLEALTVSTGGAAPDGVALAAGLTDVVRALSHRLHGREVDLRVITDRLFDVAGEGGRAPERATLAGIARVVPQEHPAIRCRLIDLDAPPESPEAAAELLDEAVLPVGPTDAVALRGGRRFERDPERFPLPAPADPPIPPIPLPADGHYLLLGGLGHFALAVAERLVARGGPGLRLTLVDRRGADELGPGSTRRLDALRASEARIDVRRADLADAAAVERALAAAVAAEGTFTGIVHSAGASSSAFGTLADLSAEDLRAIVWRLRKGDGIVRVIDPLLESADHLLAGETTGAGSVNV